MRKFNVQYENRAAQLEFAGGIRKVDILQDVVEEPRRKAQTTDFYVEDDDESSESSSNDSSSASEVHER
jgi:hypothetical protein